MNERIEELAKQCYVKTGSPHTDHFEYWKFAELIVKECCNWIDGAPSTDGGMILLTKSFVISNIKGHFGVE